MPVRQTIAIRIGRDRCTCPLRRKFDDPAAVEQHFISLRHCGRGDNDAPNEARASKGPRRVPSRIAGAASYGIRSINSSLSRSQPQRSSPRAASHRWDCWILGRTFGPPGEWQGDRILGSVQPEFRADRLEFRRLDEAGMRDGHRIQRPSSSRVQKSRNFLSSEKCGCKSCCCQM